MGMVWEIRGARANNKEGELTAGSVKQAEID